MAKNEDLDIDLSVMDDDDLQPVGFAAPVVVPPMPEKMVEAPTVKGKPCEDRKSVV